MSEKNLQLLEDSILKLPTESDVSYFPNYIKRRIENYLTHIEQFEETVGEFIQGNKQKIYDLCNALNNSINLYYVGFPTKAFMELKSVLDLIKPHLFLQKRNISVGSKDKNFYRGRIEPTRILSRYEMFHIPFEKRYLVGPQRFSITGLPCLYVSDSIYTCWEELGKPDFNKLQFSRLDINYRYLDLSFPPHFIHNLYKMAAVNKEMPEHSQDDWVINYLATWPLCLTCYNKVLDSSALFKPEYIIPQMLLEWVRTTEDLDGIKYYSTHANYTNDWHRINVYNNYAIPIKMPGESGICEGLGHSIKITDSISWPKLIEANPEIVELEYDKEYISKQFVNNQPKVIFFENEHNKMVHYVNTKFGKLEVELQKMEATSLL